MDKFRFGDVLCLNDKWIAENDHLGGGNLKLIRVMFVTHNRGRELVCMDLNGRHTGQTDYMRKNPDAFRLADD